MTTKEQYLDAIIKISKLKPDCETNKLLLSASAQMKDLVLRAASPKCEERRMLKLIWYWETYSEKINAPK